MKKFFPIFLLIISAMIFPFGKNKVQYHIFDWKYIETDHFIIYHYQGGENLAEFCAVVAEEALKSLQESWTYTLESKVRMVVYNSHSHFEETNVMGGVPDESVGGFTEFFKNRAVVPYQGNWEEFRHVIHHELTHAVMNRMFFRGNYQSIVSGIAQMNMPLWFIEGMAEYESRGGWDSESDQSIRDAVYHDYIGNVYYLNGYMAYKGGQSLFKYVADTYGKKKIGEILRGVNVIRSVEDSFLDALGTNFEDLSKDWYKWLKTRYWSTLIKTDEPITVARKLSDHEKWGNSINNSPVLSPDGKKLVFLSNKSDYFDIYLMRTFDGEIIRKVVAGQSTGEFESFKWLRPGFAWSPDSRYIAFFSKSTDSDAMFIYEAETGKRINRKKFDLDGVYYPEWSKDGDQICFTGIKDGFSDLYLYNIKTEEITKLTDDIYSDNEPKFSPDGTRIAFTSDRLDDLSTDEKSIETVLNRNMNVKEIYILDIKTGTLSRETDSDDFRQFSPFWIDDNRLGFISDETGISNLYYKDLTKDVTTPMSNFMTGCSQASYNANRIAFTTVFKAGYDIFMIEDVEALLEKNKTPLPVRWYKETDFSKKLPVTETETDFTRTDLSKFRFTKEILEKTATEVLTDEQRALLRKPKPYKVKFTPDIITVNAGYYSGYGVTGSTYLQFSDYLSNHSFVIVSDLNQDLLNSNVAVYYNYLERRINFGFGLSHDVMFYYTTFDLDGNTYIDEDYRDRLLGFHFSARYPFSRYTRIDTGLSIRSVINELYDWQDEVYHHIGTENLFSLAAGYSYDNVIWGYYGPENGTRMSLRGLYTSDLEEPFSDNKDISEFASLYLDYRKYFRLKGDYQFAIRLSGAISEGNTPQQFYLGGVSNWFNSEYNSEHEFNTVMDRYYSSGEYPLRGYRLLEKAGNRFALANVEFRYPLVRYLLIGFPFPMTFGNISGVLFSDMGSAWNNSDFRGTVTAEDGSMKLNDLLFSSGIGSRMSLGYFILRYDVSWKWDFSSSSSEPLHLLSIGANF